MNSGRQPLARTDLPLGDITSDLGRHLLVQRDGLVPDDLDNHDGDRQSITIVMTLTDEPERLVIREAQRRQRHRRLVVGITVLAVAAAALALGLTFKTTGLPPGSRSVQVGTSEVPVSSFVTRVVDDTVNARTAAFTFRQRTSAISVQGSGTVNFAAPSYSIEESLSSGLPVLSHFFHDTTLTATRTPSGRFYNQDVGEAPTMEPGNGLMTRPASTPTSAGPMAILARSPAGYGFGLLSLVPSNDLRLLGMGAGDVGGTSATTYLFGDSGQCRGTIETEVWTSSQGRILQAVTTQYGAGGKLIETLSLTLTHFGLPVTIVAPPYAAPIAARNGSIDHAGRARTGGSFEVVSFCSP